MGELPRPRMANERIFVAPHLANGDEARIRDRLLGARSHASVDFSAAGLITSAPPNALTAGCPRSIATATSRARPCRRKTASSCALGSGRRGARRAARGEERDQARGNRIATRQARPLTKASRVLERRSRQNRDRDRPAAEPEAPTRRAAYCLIGNDAGPEG
jgi:hypothetical protein